MYVLNNLLSHLHVSDFNNELNMIKMLFNAFQEYAVILHEREKEKIKEQRKVYNPVC